MNPDPKPKTPRDKPHRKKVEQFTEYLQDIEHDALGMDITLPHPEDRYPLAMGKNNRRAA